MIINTVKTSECVNSPEKKYYRSKQHYTNFRMPEGRGPGNMLGNEEQK